MAKASPVGPSLAEGRSSSKKLSNLCGLKHQREALVQKLHAFLNEREIKYTSNLIYQLNA